MTTSTNLGEQVQAVRFSDDRLHVDLRDGRTISVPLVWYPRLLHATPAQQDNWQICGGGYGIHWPDIDEDLSTAGLLRGAPAAPGTVKAHPSETSSTRTTPTTPTAPSADSARSSRSSDG